jgi:hypothetical protein
MMTIHEEYIVDDKGDRKAVVLRMAEWLQILEALEELDDIRAYDEVKQQSSDPMLFEVAVREIQGSNEWSTEVAAPRPLGVPEEK